MSFGRAACALGVVSALGNVYCGQTVEAAMLGDFTFYSSVASISVGIEVRSNEVIVAGMSRNWSGPLAIKHCTMSDALDVTGVHAMLERLGFPAAGQIADPRLIRAGFIKCEAQRNGLTPAALLNDRSRPIADDLNASNKSPRERHPPCGGKNVNAEITWDLIMSEDMSFIEGCYRLAGGEWQVVTAFKREEIVEISVRSGLRWKSGVTGMNVIFPCSTTINAFVLLDIMSKHLKIENWREVRGPDSIVLR